jgi:hypothetical protein
VGYRLFAKGGSRLRFLSEKQRDAAPVPEIIQKSKEYYICPIVTPFVRHKSKHTNSRLKESNKTLMSNNNDIRVFVYFVFLLFFRRLVFVRRNLLHFKLFYVPRLVLSI